MLGEVDELGKISEVNKMNEAIVCFCFLLYLSRFLNSVTYMSTARGYILPLPLSQNRSKAELVSITLGGSFLWSAKSTRSTRTMISERFMSQRGRRDQRSRRGQRGRRDRRGGRSCQGQLGQLGQRCRRGQRSHRNQLG